jgi:hypothetical protein
MNRCATFLCSLLPVLQGCSSSYEPARSPRVAVVAEAAGPVVVKDGQHYGTLLFGGVVDATQSNPRAEREARIGRNLAIGGFVFDLVGLGSLGAGLAVQTQHDSSPNGQPSTAAAALAVGGLVSVAFGTALLLCSPPHAYDAINIYNDGLDAPKP